MQLITSAGFERGVWLLPGFASHKIAQTVSPNAAPMMPYWTVFYRVSSEDDTSVTWWGVDENHDLEIWTCTGRCTGEFLHFHFTIPHSRVLDSPR